MRWDEVAATGIIAASVMLGTQAMQQSMGRWEQAIDGGAGWDDFRQELLDSAGISQAHHEAYAQIGSDEVWERSVKPVFLQRVGSRMVSDLGTHLAEEGAVDAWLRAHHDWIRDTLRDAADQAAQAPAPSGD